MILFWQFDKLCRQIKHKSLCMVDDYIHAKKFLKFFLH